MSGKNRVTHKKGPAVRKKKSRSAGAQAHMLDVFKSSLLAGIGTKHRIRRGGR